MVGAGIKALGFILEAKADVLIRGEAGECFEAFGKVVDVEEGGEMLPQLGMVFEFVAKQWLILRSKNPPPLPPLPGST